ncbi:MAG: hypothetical protein FWC83_00065 [Alphaproteobacteria bacterium]|nr:hypothetical protein [Alphaproteobacteria bacterium]
MNRFKVGISMFALMAVVGTAHATTFNQNVVAHGGHGRAGDGFHGASTIIGTPGVRVVNNINIGEFETRGTTAPIVVEQGPSMFYMTPENRARMEEGARGQGVPPTVQRDSVQQRQATQRSARTAAHSGDMPLAHPFWQPAAGRLGAITNIGYSQTTFDWRIPSVNSAFLGTTPDTMQWVHGDHGSWDSSQIFIRQDIMFGLTDELTLIGNIKFGMNESALDIDLTAPRTSPWPNRHNRNSNSAVDHIGIGVRYRFMDTGDMIGNITAMYHWNDGTNAIMAEGRIGKIFSGATVYGLARVWGIMWEHGNYGMSITENGNTAFIAFNEDADFVINAEFGVGAFMPLTKEISLGTELLFGHYDWHDQVSISANIAYQVSPSFALSLYGRASIWNNADSANMWGWTSGPPPYATNPGVSSFGRVGHTDISSYQDLSFGIRAMFYF